MSTESSRFETSATIIAALMQKGVRIPAPESVFVDPSVDIERISGRGTVIYPGCKLVGSSTWIGDNVLLGDESPVTVEDCAVGPDVALNGGFFQRAVFLQGAAVGSGAHVREGTILEDRARAAHTVGLKQTVLFPFVTLGSLINFCDCLMAGGTGPRNHSEVGSSFIHFNFTPNQDKATPSLIGDVPRGVMLNQSPIFLGGQGGLVGPCRLAYGTVTAAGSITRKDELRPGRLVFEGGKRGGSVPYTAGKYTSIKRIVENNILYIANLTALMQWYRHVRYQFISDRFPAPLWEGLMAAVNHGIDERIRQLDGLADRLQNSVRLLCDSAAGDPPPAAEQQQLFVDRWPEVKSAIDMQRSASAESAQLEVFSECVHTRQKAVGNDYLSVIQSLEDEAVAAGVTWLQEIVDRTTSAVRERIPEIL